MTIAVEQIIANQIELSYLSCHIDGPTHLFGDNKSVIDNSMHPSYRLKKHCCLLAFHQVREANTACDIVCAYHIDGKENPADILTKHCSSHEWYELMKPLIFWAWHE
jgi:hypothetical protein